MNGILSAINQILDGLGVSASLGQGIVSFIEFLIVTLPGWITTAVDAIAGLFG